MKHLNTLILAIAAGAAIAIGGTVYLTLDNKMVGAVLFSVGLYTICLYKLNLFTGKIGYAVNNPPSYLGFTALVWLGNLIGTGLCAAMINMTRAGKIAETAAAVCAVKNGDTMLSLFILGIFCGMLMYAAVEGFKLTGNPLILFFCVSVFILCGFEHCIADMFYYSLAGMWNIDVLIRVFVITIGNALGGMFLPAIARLNKASS